MTGPHIRAASAADLAVLLDLDATLFGVDAWSRTAMSEELRGSGGPRGCLVAVSGETVVGYAVLRTTADVADLLRIGVTPASQRAGIGSALVSAVVQRSRAAGCGRLLLEVASDNVAAMSLYRLRGFESIAVRPRYYADASDALVMEKRLHALDEQRDG